jgi:hypothetical protein
MTRPRLSTILAPVDGRVPGGQADQSFIVDARLAVKIRDGIKRRTRPVFVAGTFLKGYDKRRPDRGESVPIRWQRQSHGWVPGAVFAREKQACRKFRTTVRWTVGHFSKGQRQLA